MSTALSNPPAQTLTDAQARELICEMCRQFYAWGWASGTGGGISVRSGDKIYMAPSGVPKERMKPEDMFVLDANGEVIESPKSNAKVSACHPLFMHGFNLRGAGAVLHSHSMNAMLVSLLYGKQFQITGVEMIKGIRGMGVFDLLEVPIIENTAYECDLADSMKEAVLANPKADAVLVRGHGVYIWGKDWIQAKTQAECYDYLFAAAIKMKEHGIDPTKGRK